MLQKGDQRLETHSANMASSWRYDIRFFFKLALSSTVMQSLTKLYTIVIWNGNGLGADFRHKKQCYAIKIKLERLKYSKTTELNDHRF